MMVLTKFVVRVKSGCRLLMYVIAVTAVIVTSAIQCAAPDCGLTSLNMSSWIFGTP